MAVDTQTQAEMLAEVGRRLHEEAKANMKSSRYYRRRAALLHAKVQELIEQCAEYGIDLHLEVNIPPPMPQGGTSGDNDSQDP